MLAPDLNKPTISNLWDYHRHFYAQIDDAAKKDYIFEDVAGLINKDGKTNIFTICSKYKKHPNICELPTGKYLCANCTEEKCEETIKFLLTIAQNQYNKRPDLTIQIIILTGILQWNYQIQVYIS